MAALPAHLTFDCPVCDAPVELPLRAGGVKPAGHRVVFDLGLDMEPIKQHLRAEHSELLAAAPLDAKALEAAAAAASTRDATVHVHVHPTPRPEDTRKVLDAAARVSRVGRR